MFTVVERRTISDELAATAEGWLAHHGLAEEVDEGWLDLVCGTVDLTLDAQWGRLHRTDRGVTVQWTR
ncbi:MAG: hypothetical protein M3071_08755 [Actinomycetota bacterium]|nr:hypothetical protein [Actinomycetota bacterium]